MAVLTEGFRENGLTVNKSVLLTWWWHLPDLGLFRETELWLNSTRWVKRPLSPLAS